MGRGRGGGGGGRGGAPMSRDVQVSKKLSKLLRHDAEQEGLKLGKGGYVNLGDVLANRNIKSLNPRTSLSEIREIVASNAKQRFSLIHISDATSVTDVPAEEAQQPNDTSNNGATASTGSTTDSTHENDDDPSHYLIRANQGHSIKLEADDLLTPITLESSNLPTTVVHGTRHDHWAKILVSGGLKPMGRNHVHFATGVPESLRPAASKDQDVSNDDREEEELAALPEDKAAPTVLSGMRNSSSILIFIDIKAALQGGLQFWMSENGVVLSAGDEQGIVPMRFFERVEEKGGRVLVEGGVVVAEAERRERGHGRGRGGYAGGGRGRGRGDRGGRGDGGQGRGVIPRDI